MKRINDTYGVSKLIWNNDQDIYPNGDWAPTQPNFSQKKQFCGEYRKEFSFYWNDWNCDNHLNVVCQCRNCCIGTHFELLGLHFRTCINFVTYVLFL